MGEPFLIGPNLVYNTLEKVHILRNRLKIAYSRKKSDVDHRRRALEFYEGDKVYLKISPMKGMVRFCKRWKLIPRYVGPYDILQRVRKVAYELKLVRELAAIHPVLHVSMIKSVSVIQSVFFLLRVLV